jgi:L-seryl-tRNA(Ser) seleniumtransferase
VILGRKDFIDRIKKNPLNRAVRIDKFTLAALEATLRLYLDQEKALANVPTLRMITMPYQTLRRRAARLKKRLAAVVGDSVEVDLADGYSQIGGGALPDQDLKTRMVTLRPLTQSVNRLEQWLRGFSTPIIGRIENEVLVLDLRTMAEDDFEVVGLAMAGWHKSGAGA